MKEKYLENKVFLVTGASSGIGYETTMLLLENGSIVYAMVRNVAALAELQKQYKKNLIVFKGDVTRQKECEKFVNIASKKENKLYGLIHCAGVGIRSSARQIKEEVFHDVMNTNFYAMIYLFNATRRYLESSRGHVVAVSSVQGIVALPYRSVYSAAKHALNAFIRSVRFEEKDIHFLCVNYGYVKTRFSHNALTGDGKKFNQQGRGQSKGMDARKAATLMLKAMVGRKKEIIPAGIKIKFALCVYRFFPWLFDKFADRYAEKI